MQAQTIAQLAWYKPITDSEYAKALDILTTLPLQRVTNIIHYAECHRNLQFGWEFAEEMALHPDVVFPAILHGDDLYVWRAYKYLTGYNDPVIASVLALTLPENKMLSDLIKALLITDKVTCKFVADKLNIPIQTICAFEKLFFNVIDRKKDKAFISQIVYPNGRLVEAAENYIESTGMSDILLRAGFVRGADHVLYAMGLQDNPYGNEDAVEAASRLDKAFLTSGCLYATLGWANLRMNARPILNARASMIAGKMGKGESSGAAMSCITPALTFRSELNTVSRLKMEARTKSLAAAAPPVIPLNLSYLANL